MATFFVFQFFAFLGLVGHWGKRYIRSQTDNNFFYYMSGHWRYTMSSIITQIAGVFIMMASGADSLSMSTIGAAFMIGYMCDSAMNKDHYSGVS